MKKLLTVFLAVLMVVSLVSCGGGKTPANNNETGKNNDKANNAQTVEATSDVELLDTAGNIISYLFAPEGFVFDEVSAKGGYNSGRNHGLETEDDEYEIDAGLIANSDSALYDLFVNGELTKTVYNGMEIDPEEEYALESKDELDFEIAGNKVFYIETIIGNVPLTYVVFEHTADDEESALYGLDLWSYDEEFYAKDNFIKVFKEVFGIGRTESAVYFDRAAIEEVEETYGTIESADMIYGSDEYPVTIYKPENGTLELDAEDVEEALDFVWITSDDYEWTIDVSDQVLYYNGNATDALVEYYYNGELDYFADEYAYFDAYDYELDIEFDGEPVRVIEYTFADANDPDDEETEYFVGVEFEDTFEGEYYGDGLFGFRYYMFDETPSDDELASLFCEIFGIDGYEFDIPEKDDDWDDWGDDEGFDTDLIVGEWQAVDAERDEVFFFYASDYATYTLYGEEYELTYSLSDDAVLLIEFDGENSVDYTVSFDGSDTMYLIDVDGNEIEFERI